MRQSIDLLLELAKENSEELRVELDVITLMFLVFRFGFVEDSKEDATTRRLIRYSSFVRQNVRAKQGISESRTRFKMSFVFLLVLCIHGTMLSDFNGKIIKFFECVLSILFLRSLVSVKSSTSIAVLLEIKVRKALFVDFLDSLLRLILLLEVKLELGKLFGVECLELGKLFLVVQLDHLLADLQLPLSELVLECLVLLPFCHDLQILLLLVAESLLNVLVQLL